MTLAELIAIEKQHETELLRNFETRKKIMRRSYDYKTNLTIEQNDSEKEKFDKIAENTIIKHDKEIQSLKDKIFSEKQTINEANVTEGIDVLLQKIKFNKIELSYLNLDKYDFGNSNYDASEKIKNLEIEKVKLLNKVMKLNHETKL